MEKLVEVDARALLKLTEELAEIPQVIPQAVASAINKTMSSTVTQIKREVASEYTVKQKDVSKAIKQTKARSSRLKAAAVAGGVLAVRTLLPDRQAYGSGYRCWDQGEASFH